MVKDYTQDILKKWNISDEMDEYEKARALFEKVRDIPFGSMGSRQPQDVYERNMGTCSGKNILLRDLYNAVGIKTKDMICLQRWKDLTWFEDPLYNIVYLPEHLMQKIEKIEIVDFHNYVRAFIGGKWVNVDVTIDLPLTKLGFYTTTGWDAKKDMNLCFIGTAKVWDCGDKGLEEKDRLTALLPQEIQRARKDFLVSLTSWIGEKRAEGAV